MTTNHVNHPKISIIIPVYNTSKTLLMDCFTSILDQNYNNFECLIINDFSSSEETNSFLKAFVIAHHEFKLYTLPSNKGPGYARNHGIQKSVGEIITFIDSDDYVKPECLMEISKAFVANHDLEIFSFENVVKLKTGEFIKSADYTFDTGVVNVDTFNNAVLDKCSVWAKAYSRKFITEKKVYFLEENLFMEDLYYLIISFSRAKKIKFSKLQLYVLNENDNSRSRSNFTFNKALGLFEVVRQGYFATKNDNNFISKNYSKLFNLWFFYKLKELRAEYFLGNNKLFVELIQKAKEFQKSIS